MCNPREIQQNLKPMPKAARKKHIHPKILVSLNISQKFLFFYFN